MVENIKNRTGMAAFFMMLIPSLTVSVD